MEKYTLRELRAAVQAGPPYDKSFLALLETDPRVGARALYDTCGHRMARNASDHDHGRALIEFDERFRAQGFKRLAGVDEAGRGPLAGPIVAGAVILAHPIPGLNDSKQLTPARREELFASLHKGDHTIGKAIVSREEIDHWGIQSANYAAMARAVTNLEPPPDFLVVDGFRIPGCPIPHERVIKGDQRSQAIAAASIVAKVVRDRIMIELDKRYPGYGFAQHKGYATPEHLEALERLGPCPEHRTSFAPIARVAETGLLFAPDEEERSPCE